MVAVRDVEVGSDLPELTKPIEQAQLVAYAGATWDFHRYHYDQEYARSREMPATIADGQMFGAFLAQFVLDWAGPNAFIRRMDIRYKSLVHPGDEVTCAGSVAGKNTDSRQVTIEASVRARDGRDVVSPAVVVVELADS